MPQKVPSLPTMYCDCCLHISSAISIRTAPAAHKKRAPHTHTAPVFPKTLPERIPIRRQKLKRVLPQKKKAQKKTQKISLRSQKGSTPKEYIFPFHKVIRSDTLAYFPLPDVVGTSFDSSFERNPPCSFLYSIILSAVLASDAGKCFQLRSRGIGAKARLNEHIRTRKKMKEVPTMGGEVRQSVRADYLMKRKYIFLWCASFLAAASF